MGELHGFPSAELLFDRDGNVQGSTSAADALAGTPAVTDVMVMVHGWNNDEGQARSLFDRLAASMRTVLDSAAVPAAAQRRIGLLGVIWPSRKFDDAPTASGRRSAGVGSGPEPDALRAQIDGLRAVFPRTDEQKILDEVGALVPDLEDRATARAEFADKVRSLVGSVTADPEDGPTDFLAVPGPVVMDRLAVPARLAAPGRAAGGAAALGPGGDPGDGRGRAAGLGSILGGVLGAATNLLNYTTFYEMKGRSGTVGERGLAPWLAGTHAGRAELRLHLVGHSFGARLVCAASLGVPSAALASVALLQAAFSHFGLSPDWDPTPGDQPGYFARMLGESKVRGPILITHTANDTAVGIAYALASRLAGQTALAVGDANDIYGGMGRNGAQQTPSAVASLLTPVGGTYSWVPGAAHNLLADAFVAGHSDVTGEQVAYALLSALAATP